MRFALLANHFGRRYRHLIAAMDGAYDCCDRLSADVDYEIVDPTAPKRATLRNAWRFRRELKRLSPDLLLTYNWGAIEWALANYVPLCPHVHLEDGFGPEEADGQARRRVLLRRLVLGRTEKVIIPSRTLYDIARRTWKLDERRLEYLPNGIDCRRFDRPPDGELLRRLGIAGDRPLIGTVAGLRPEKNLSRLLRAFAVVRKSVPARLLIAGEGAQRSLLEELARDLGVSGDVLFAGHLSEPERVLGALDVFALSSDTEQMPYTVIEAMAAGVAVAGVDVGDVKWMVAPENRAFIVEKNEVQLAGAIRDLLRDRVTRRTIGEANRRRARREFDQQQFLEKYERVFETPCAALQASSILKD